MNYGQQSGASSKIFSPNDNGFVSTTIYREEPVFYLQETHPRKDDLESYYGQNYRNSKQLEQEDASSSLSSTANGDEYVTEKTKKLKTEELAEQYQVDHKKLMRKVDWCVIPPFAFLYFVSFLNKSSFGLVYVDGIVQDLQITKLQLAGAYAAFFAPIILLQFFSNVALRIVKPHFFIAFSVLFYGVFNLACGFARNYATLVVCQFFHGIFQAGSESAVIYIMAHYYQRNEAQRRFSGLYSVNCLGGMTANLISYGIHLHLAGPGSAMYHDNNSEYWRWLMIIVGSITMATAILLFFTIPDFPEGARFFSDSETFFIIKKLEIYGGRSGYTLDTRANEALQVTKDPLVYLPAITGLGFGFIVHGYSLFEPVIYEGLGIEVTDSNQKSAFPWILAFAYINMISFLSDFFHRRFIFLAFNAVVTIIGAILIVADPAVGKSHFKYAGNFMIVCGGFASMPFLICWSSLNVCGHLRKSTLTSFEISAHDLGGFIALFCFTQDDRPFRKAFITGFSLEAVGLIAASAYLFLLVHRNKMKRSNKYKADFAMRSNREKMIMGDKNPNFDYMY